MSVRKIFLLLLLAPLLAVAQQRGPVITWDQSVFDFGDVAQGDKVEHTFTFKNTGDQPLVISNVQVTCGCTTPKGWPRDPVLPGKSAELTILFNSSGKYGRMNKVVTVISNAVNPEGAQLTFTVNVLSKRIP